MIFHREPCGDARLYYRRGIDAAIGEALGVPVVEGEENLREWLNVVREGPVVGDIFTFQIGNGPYHFGRGITLKILNPSRRRIRPGDIFVMQPLRGDFVFGRAEKGTEPFIDRASFGRYTLFMPRVARSVVPDIPYHVTQRGNRRQDVFFGDDDRRRYLSYLGEYAKRYSLDILSYCLMTNHVHLVVIPRSLESMAVALRSAHSRYSQLINSRFGWTGHMWQGRYFSTALDDPHLWAAIRYVERNPVRSGLAEQAWDYPWSSAAFHVGAGPDELITKVGCWGCAVGDWQDELAVEQNEQVVDLIRRRTHSGFPCGSEEFVERLSQSLGRSLILRGRGRPRKS
jgi:putative transposase